MRSYAHHNRLLVKRYEDWMTALHYVQTTKTYYRKVLVKFNLFMGKRSITGVTHLEIRAFLTHVSNYGATLQTTYRYLGVLRRFYDFLNLGGVVSYVAPRLVRIKGTKRIDLPMLTEPEVKRLIAATKTKRERALLEFAYSTGCRVSEMTHLRVENINFEDRSVRIRGKLNKTRIAFLTPSASAALRAYIQDRKSGYVFQEDRRQQHAGISATDGYWVARCVDYSRRFPCGTYLKKWMNLGRIDSVSRETAREKLTKLLADVNLTRPQPNRPLTTSLVVYVLARIGQRAGLKNVGIHMIRRSFATHLYDHGVNIEIIQKLLGHVYLGTTLTYTRLSRTHMARAIDQNHPLAGAHEVLK
jgi:site-specific recombinase XerD